jgi:hypothetical protein
MSNFASFQHTDQSARDAKATAEQAHATERRTPNIQIKTGAKAVLTVRGEQASIEQPKLASHNVADNKPAPSSSSSYSSPSSTGGEQVVTAKSSMGRQLTGNDIREDSIVTVGGFETTVAAAKAIGKIRVNAAGVLVYADESLAPKADAAPKGTHKPTQQDQQQPTKPAEIEKLDDASEALMTELVAATSKVGNMDVAAVQKHLTEEGSVPTDLLNRLATGMGQEPAVVAQKLAQVREAFTKQAYDSVGAVAPEVFEWANQHAPQELRAAIDQQVKHGTTKGYQAISQKFMEQLDRLRPGFIENTTEGKQLQARREPDGTVSIVHPKYGRISWQVAIRKGLFKPSFKYNPFTR